MRQPSRWQELVLLLACLPAAALAGTEPLVYEQQVVTLAGERRTVRLPKGYRLELLSDSLNGARLLTFAGNGDLFIGSKSGKVYRLPPPYTEPQVLVSLGGYPHSVAFRKDEILIARTDGLYRAPYRPGQAKIDRDSVRLLAELPGGGGHSSRTVAVGPDGRVYLSLGISGNCSDQYLGDPYPFEDRRGGVLVLREVADGPSLARDARTRVPDVPPMTSPIGEDSGRARWETFGSGLRNPVGFAWHPGTRVLYASNNGPDHHGFELPPEYFSRVEAGSFHGMPWFQFDGRKIRRDDCVSRPPPRPLAEVTPPVATFPSRNAPMGVAFVPAGAMHKALEFDALVALRGSWGTQPGGGALGNPATRRAPKIVAVRFEDGRAKRVDDLLTGFQLDDGERWARPVGVAIGPDGALYFTSDSGINGLFRLRKLR